MWQLHITRHPTAIWWSHHQKSVWRIPSSQYIPNMPKSITSQTIPNYPKLNGFSLGSIQEKAPFRVHFTDMDHLGWLGWMGKNRLLSAFCGWGWWFTAVLWSRRIRKRTSLQACTGTERPGTNCWWCFPSAAMSSTYWCLARREFSGMIHFISTRWCPQDS